MGDPAASWQALTRAWQLSPGNNYAVLGGMVNYFLLVGNFDMAEKSCQLLLEIAPHDLVVLGLMTEAMLGQGRYEEAIKVGMPVVELSAQLGELPDRMSINLVKQMADYLLKKKDFAGAARLWEAGVRCQPGEVDALLGLFICLMLVDDEVGARQRLEQARALAPQNETVLALIKQVGDPLSARPSKKREHRK